MVIIEMQQGGDKVISWWWLIPAVMVGAIFGIFAIAIVSNGRGDD